MTERLVRVPASPAVRAAMADVAARDPRFAPLAGAGMYAMPADLPSLVRVVIGQLVSTRAADAIFARLSGCLELSPEAIGAAPDDVLLGAGLGRAKTACVRAIAAEGLDFAALAGLPDDAVVRRLTAIRGVGRWTAEVFALAALGRLDVCPATDLAVQVGWGRLAGLGRRAGEAEVRAGVAHLAPWRGVAGFMLWHLYLADTTRPGVT